MLLSTSIRENLLLANPSATTIEILDACEVAGAMEFIERLPDGIDTVIGKGRYLVGWTKAEAVYCSRHRSPDAHTGA